MKLKKLTSELKAAEKIASCMAISLLLAACDTFSDQHPSVKVALSTAQLKPAPSGFTYEAWVSLNVQPISLGRFSIDESGAMSENSFEIDEQDLRASTRVFVTLEPTGEDLPGPSSYVVMGGKFVDDVAHLSIDDDLAFKTDFSKGEAGFVIQTPTDGRSEAALSGIWFYNGSESDPQPTLRLPELPDVWTYEANFETENGTPLSLGTFPAPQAPSESSDQSESQSESEPQHRTEPRAAVGTYVAIRGADRGNPYRPDARAAPSFPGEDFLTDSPQRDLPFPMDVRGGKLSISVRAKDEDADLVLFTIYKATLAKNAQANTVYPMAFTHTEFPTGALDRAPNR